MVQRMFKRINDEIIKTICETICLRYDKGDAILGEEGNTPSL